VKGTIRKSPLLRRQATDERDVRPTTMKHAGTETLMLLDPLLVRLREIPGLVERTPGAFYFRSKAFLHFHEDPAGIFADVKLDLTDFERLPVRTRAEQTRLVRQVASVVAAAGRKVRG